MQSPFPKTIRSLWRVLPLGVRRWGLEQHALMTQRPLDPRRPVRRGDVTLIGLLGMKVGVGEAARQMVERFQSMGILINPINLSKTLKMDDFDYETVQSPDPYSGGMVILSLNPEHMSLVSLAYKRSQLLTRRVVGVWYWELETFPASWVKALRFVDEVWVASRFIADGLRPIAGDKPVHLVPLPLNIGAFLTVPSKDVVPALAGKTIVFFMYDVRSAHARKNPEAVIKAYRLAAEHNPACVLVMKIGSSSAWPESEARLRALAVGCASIHFLQERFSAEDMKNLMARVDIVISLHRSEGFGLLMAEAMASGKPVIATGYSANLDFMTPECAVLVDYTMIDVVDPQHIFDSHNAQWAEPNIDHAAEALRRLIASPEERQRLGKAARAHIADYLSEENWPKFLPPSFWDSLVDPPTRSQTKP